MGFFCGLAGLRPFIWQGDSQHSWEFVGSRVTLKKKKKLLKSQVNVSGLAAFLQRVTQGSKLLLPCDAAIWPMTSKFTEEEREQWAS